MSATRVGNLAFSTGSTVISPTRYYDEVIDVPPGRTIDDVLAERAANSTSTGPESIPQAGPSNAESQDSVAAEKENSQPARSPEFDEDILRATQYLSRIPPLPYAIQSQNENSSIHQGSGGGESRPLFQDDDPIDIVVVDLYRRVRESLQSIQSLRNHLRERRGNNHLRYVYLIPKESLPLGVAGLIGSFLGLHAEFWTTHGGNVGTLWGQLRPTLISQRRIISVAFVATDQNGSRSQVLRHTVSLGFQARRTSVAILLPRYPLRDSIIRNLSLDTDYVGIPNGTSAPPPLTSLDAMVPMAIWHSTVTYEELAPIVARALFPPAVSEWTETLEALETELRNSDSTESGQRRDPSAGPSGLRSLVSRRELTHLLTHLACSWDSLRHICGTTFVDPGVPSSGDDIKYLQLWSDNLEQREQKLRDDEYRQKPPLPTSNGRAELSGGGGRAALPDPDPVPPKKKPPMEDIKLKVDQIAYVTTLLLSLTFIATIYGMNVSNFSAEGIPTVIDYLAVALPFAAGVFFLTFVPSGLLQRGSREARGQKLVTITAV